MKFAHIAVLKKLTAGQKHQLEYELRAARELGLHWRTVVFQEKNEADDCLCQRIPFPFRNKVMRGLYAWVQIWRISRSVDWLLVRYIPFDAWSFLSFFVKNRISIHHAIEPLEIRMVRRGIVGRVAALADRIFGAIAVSTSVAVAGVTQEITAYQQTRVHRRIAGTTYANGIEVSCQDELPDGRDAGVVRAVFICGKFSDWQGLDLLLARARQEDFSGGQLEIHLVGELSSAQERMAAESCSPHVKFISHGYCTEVQCRALMASSDVGISSLALFRKGLTQASTLKVREMLAVGLPVISGHQDPALDADFLFYRRADVSPQEIFNYAIAMRGYSKNDVRAAALVFISKREIMRRFTEWLDDQPLSEGRQ